MALTTVPSSLSATAITLTTAAQPNITSVGTLTGLAVTGNATITKEGPTLTLTDSSSSRTLLNFVDDNNSVVRASGPLLLQSGGAVSALTLDASRNATFAGNVTVSTSGSTALTLSGDFPRLYFVDTAGSDLDAYIVNNANGLFFGKTNSPTASNDIMMLDLTNQRVGIGVSNPAHKLDVEAGANQFDLFRVGSSASDNNEVTIGYFDANATNGLPALTNGSDFGGLIQGGEHGKLVFGIRDNDATDSIDIVSGSGNFMTDSTYDKLIATFRADGNVGIGTNTPNEILHIKGDGARIYVDSADYNLFSIGRRSSSGAGLDQAYLRMKSAGTNTIVLDTAGDSYFNGGNVVIGGTTQQGGGLLTLEGPDAAMLTLHRTADTGDQEILFYDHGDHNATIIGKTGGDLQFRTNGRNSVAMHLKSDGNVGIGASPSRKLDVIGASNQGIRLKAGAQIAYTPTSSDFYNGLTLENLSSGHAYSVAYGQGGRLKFSYFDNSSTYEELAHMRPGGDFYPAGSVVLSNGEGINFSATGQASGMSGELLDDYEEGTWTPLLIAATTNPTGGGALNPYGSYTKVGNRVTVTYYVGRSYTNTPAGQIYVSGLPFPVKNVVGNVQYHYIATYNINFSGGMTMGVPDRGASTFNLYMVRNSTSWAQIDWTSHTSSPIYVSGSFSYIVD